MTFSISSAFSKGKVLFSSINSLVRWSGRNIVYPIAKPLGRAVLAVDITGITQIKNSVSHICRNRELGDESENLKQGLLRLAVICSSLYALQKTAGIQETASEIQHTASLVIPYAGNALVWTGYVARKKTYDLAMFFGQISSEIGGSIKDFNYCYPQMNSLTCPDPRFSQLHTLPLTKSDHCCEIIDKGIVVMMIPPAIALLSGFGYCLSKIQEHLDH